MGMVAAVVALALGVLPGTGSRDDAACAGGTTFYFNFQAQSTSQVHVYKDGVEVTDGFTKTLNADGLGGSVVFGVAPTCTTLRVQRETPITQGLTLGAYSPFPAKKVEKTLDVQVMQTQEVDRRARDMEAAHTSDIAAVRSDFAAGDIALAATHAADKAAQATRDTTQDVSLANEIAARAAADAATLSQVISAVGTLDGRSLTASDQSSVLAFGSDTPRTLTSRFAEEANVKDCGAKGDSTTDDRADIVQCEARGLPLYFPPGTYRIASSYTTTQPWRLAWGAKVLLDGAGVTLLLTKGFDKALLDQAFLGTGKAYFTGGGRVGLVSIMWWGAKGDDATDSTAAIQAAVYSLLYGGSDRGGTVLIPLGVFKITNTVFLVRDGLSTHGMRIVGASKRNSRVKLYNTGAANAFEIPHPGEHGFSGVDVIGSTWFDYEISNFQIEADTTALGTGHGLYIADANNVVVRHMQVQNMGGSGLVLSAGADSDVIEHSNFLYNGRWGIELIGSDTLNSVTALEINDVECAFNTKGGLLGYKVVQAEIANSLFHRAQVEATPGEGVGVALDNSYDVTLRRNWMEINPRGNIYLHAVHDVKLDGNWLSTSGRIDYVGDGSGSTYVASDPGPAITSNGANEDVHIVRTHFKYNHVADVRTQANDKRFVVEHPVNEQTITTGSISSGSASLTVANAAGFAITDNSGAAVPITVAGAGAAGADLVTTITNISGAVVTLATTASTTVAGAAVTIPELSRVTLDNYAPDTLVVTNADGWWSAGSTRSKKWRTGGSTGNSMARPAVGAGEVDGELRGVNRSNPTSDDGFLRMCAGGGSDGNSKCCIDLSGYSTVADMNKTLVVTCGGAQKFRIDANGITAPNLPVYGDNAAAVAGGLTAGRMYRTSTGQSMIVY